MVFLERPKMKIATILGTRPEIIKLSPLLPSLDKEFSHILVHTGQHYDYALDKVFFEELHLSLPDYHLNIGSHSPGKQTGMMLEKIEEVFLKEKPELVLVQGDTNTTLAGALAAAKLHIPIMHIEAGCRSFNRKMPEEINRVVVDHLSSFLVAPDQKALENLRQEGIPEENIHHCGSTAFDAVLRNRQYANQKILAQLGLQEKNFVLVTLHRAENTEDPNLTCIMNALQQLSQKITVVFPIHPRTRKALEQRQILLRKEIKAIEPQSYFTFLALLSSCRFCISDSGGIQEEAVAFNVPCLIPRKETEWTRLVDDGKNILMGTDTKYILEQSERLLDDNELEKMRNKPIQYYFGAAENIKRWIEEIKNTGNDKQ